jgi:hypothetical protein
MDSRSDLFPSSGCCAINARCDSFLSLTTKKNPKRPRKHYKYHVLVLEKRAPEEEERSEGAQKSIETPSWNFIFFVFNLCLVL